MKKVNSHLKSYVQKLKGTLLGIGIEEEKIIELIDENDDIYMCDLLECAILSSEDGKKQKLKKIPITKLKKVFKKKRFDYIIANASILQPYFKTFVRDSIYLGQKTIYIYTDFDYDYERLQIMYERYNASFKVEKCQDGQVIWIDLQNAKNHKFKNKFYYIMDTIIEIIDKIGDYLTQ